MSLSPESHVTEPEKKAKRMPAWVIVLIILALLLLIVVCCLITLLFVLPQLFDFSILNWLGGF